jgi:hypothetical protein
MLLILLILVLLSIGGGGAFYYKKMKDEEAQEQEAQEQEAQEQEDREQEAQEQEAQEQEAQEQEESTYSRYTKHVDTDVVRSDLGCETSGVPKEFCEKKCDDNTDCIGYNYIAAGGPWGEKSGCCVKNNDTGGVLVDFAGVDFYMKN